VYLSTRFGEGAAVDGALDARTANELTQTTARIREIRIGKITVLVASPILSLSFRTEMSVGQDFPLRSAPKS